MILGLNFRHPCPDSFVKESVIFDEHSSDYLNWKLNRKKYVLFEKEFYKCPKYTFIH